MRRIPRSGHQMKMVSATTRKRRPPRTGATSVPLSGRAAPLARPPQAAEASAAQWTRRLPALSAPPVSPSALPAPWVRSATRSPTPHSSPTQASLISPRGRMQNCAVHNPHSRSEPSTGRFTVPPPPLYTPPLQLSSWNPQHSRIHNAVPFLSSRTSHLCPGVP